MTKAEAFALGRLAFAEGKGNLPFADPDIAAELDGAKPGEKTHLLKAFSRGWHAANANAPLD